MPSSLQLQRHTLMNHHTTIPTTGHRQPKPTRDVCPITTTTTPTPDHVIRYHTHSITTNQCCSHAEQYINAPIETIWSIIRRFDKPQTYKHFLKSCKVIIGDGSVGTLREVRVVSGMPAEGSIERLEILDEERRVMSFRVVGGEHRLHNYKSVTTLHAACGGGTVVVESYVVDVPMGNTVEETCAFVDTILRCNLHSLAKMAENLAKDDHHDYNKD